MFRGIFQEFGILGSLYINFLNGVNLILILTGYQVSVIKDHCILVPINMLCVSL